MAKKLNNKVSGKSIVKDTIIVVLLVALVGVEIYSTIVNPDGVHISVAEVLDSVAPVAVSFVGLIEIFRYLGWTLFVPDFMLRKQKEERQEEIQECMDAYFHNEANFIHDYSEEKIGYILTQLNISTNQLDKIRLNLIEMRCIPLRSLDDAKQKIIEYIKCNEAPMVIHQDNVDSAKLTHGHVHYFVNFIDSMFLPGYCSEISSVLAYLIKEKADMESFDKIVIPHDSNFMLGVEVGKRLGRPVVKMRQIKGRVIQEQCWDGELKNTDRVIIIHDVLVTADQVLHAITNIPKTCNVVGLFCLVERKEWEGSTILNKNGVDVHRLLALDDNDIRAITEGKYVPREQKRKACFSAVFKKTKNN